MRYPVMPAPGHRHLEPRTAHALVLGFIAVDPYAIGVFV